MCSFRFVFLGHTDYYVSCCLGFCFFALVGDIRCQTISSFSFLWLIGRRVLFFPYLFQMRNLLFFKIFLEFYSLLAELAQPQEVVCRHLSCSISEFLKIILKFWRSSSLYLYPLGSFIQSYLISSLEVSYLILSMYCYFAVVRG